MWDATFLLCNKTCAYADNVPNVFFVALKCKLKEMILYIKFYCAKKNNFVKENQYVPFSSLPYQSCIQQFIFKDK